MERRVLKHLYPNRGEPWSKADDRRLWRYVEQYKHIDGYGRWRKIGSLLGRTPLATSNRYFALRSFARALVSS